MGFSASVLELFVFHPINVHSELHPSGASTLLFTSEYFKQGARIDNLNPCLL